MKRNTTLVDKIHATINVHNLRSVSGKKKEKKIIRLDENRFIKPEVLALKPEKSLV